VVFKQQNVDPVATGLEQKLGTISKHWKQAEAFLEEPVDIF
jgi:hypothetical protein